MPYIKPEDRKLLDPFIENLRQAIGTDNIGRKLYYAISRLVASVYAPNGEWCELTIQKAMGLYTLLTHEFYRRVGATYNDEQMNRNGDILEYQQADDQDNYRTAARILVEKFTNTATYRRSEFDQMISNIPILDRQPDGFTDRAHRDGYIVMGKDTVTLGLLGLELRKNAQH